MHTDRASGPPTVVFSRSLNLTVSSAGERMYQIDHSLEERQREQQLTEIYRQRHEEVHHVPADDMMWSRPRNAVLASSPGGQAAADAGTL